MSKVEFSARIGLRLPTSDKKALEELAQNLGFPDLTAMLRAVITDLLKGQVPLKANGQYSLEQLDQKLAALTELVLSLKQSDLRQLRIGLFILGTEQVLDEEGNRSLANPAQTVRMKKLFPEFTQKQETNEKQ